ncbi:leucine-rich repeat-containing 19-like isoform X2 [Paramuricea clavata]|uniref:Leucine-rich repeat-containing 19-like isoform X2 n=1 Tax=Paramuricea clavata TaxID=317549 RepID=A0A7D9LHJ0_PARCT|nr:leucine-rich repeat-containing 19-like isoform X2 [Paramuricea clavata]
MNWITKLDADLFSSLNTLRLLSLRKNIITKLEDEIFSGLANLQYLYLDNNELIDIGSSVFGTLFGLKVLISSRAYDCEFSKSMQEYSYLKEKSQGSGGMRLSG